MYNGGSLPFAAGTAVAGVVLAYQYLRKKPKLHMACIVLPSLIALALVVYIGLVFILLGAIQHQLPAP